MIEFKKLRFKNLFSYGNAFTEIDFEKCPMTLISGKNGSGKSAIGEALTFVLFGVPFRNINKPNIVNSINEKDCLTEIEFVIGKKKYLVRRGIKPTIFEIYCDGKIIDQDSKSKDYQKYLEKNILKLNYKSFTQLVFLGSSNFVPFMQLTPQDRREVIEELLDIRVFSNMNVVLKEKQSLLKENIKEIDKKIEISSAKINLQKQHLTSLKEKNQEIIDSNNKEIENIKKQSLDMKKSIDLFSNDIIEKSKQLKKLESLKNKHDQINVLEKQINDQLNKLKKSLAFYNEKEICPTCNQNITEEFKEKETNKKKENINNLSEGLKKLLNEKDEVLSKIKVLSDIEKEILKLQVKKADTEARLNGVDAYIMKLEKDNERLSNIEKTDKEENEKYVKLQEESNLFNNEKTLLLEDKSTYDVVSDMLKDSGIKSKIIKQYLPIMNELINKYLLAMDFYVNFNIDENFKEIIKSRYRDTFEYNSFSQGQKFRIDMALLLTWREISRKKNSTNTNILILDEIFDSCLDAGGTEDFMKLLKILSKKTNIFVISHKPDVISDKFDRHLKVEMKNNFSSIV